MLDHFEKAFQTEPRHFLADIEQQSVIEALREAKLGILIASLCAGIIGSIVLVRIKRKDQT